MHCCCSCFVIYYLFKDPATIKSVSNPSFSGARIISCIVQRLRTFGCCRFLPNSLFPLLPPGRVCRLPLSFCRSSPLPASPSRSNSYLGEPPEWELIPQDDKHVLPFEKHRGEMARQRVSDGKDPLVCLSLASLTL